MVWQLVAMWLIVGVTVVWFVRDERRLHDTKLRLQALRFATKPHYRDTVRQLESEPAIPAPRQAGLSAENRAFMQDFIDRVHADV